MLAPVFIQLVALSALVAALPGRKRASCTVSSIDDDVSDCSSVSIEAFTVPAGETFTLDLADGTTVTLNGDVLFGNKTWDGPLFSISKSHRPFFMLSGSDITFDGNGYLFDGGGPYYWDGQGGNGGVTKPDPMMKIKMSGTFKNLKILNSPQRVFSVGNDDPLTISGCTVDNSQGDEPNDNSDGDPAGHNTDGFDVSADDVTITGNTVMNQDDCLAINKGSNIVFSNNTCSGGHGISIGSISSDVTVSGIQVTGNTVKDSAQAIRIKTKSSASGSTVSNVTYSGNSASGITDYGVIIDQSYPDTLGTPGTGVTISDVDFSGEANTIEVGDDAIRVAVNCGDGACTGTWDWSDLTVSGGEDSQITGFDDISGGSY